MGFDCIMLIIAFLFTIGDFAPQAGPYFFAVIVDLIQFNGGRGGGVAAFS